MSETSAILVTVGMGIGAEIAQKVVSDYTGIRPLIFLGKKEVLPTIPVHKSDKIMSIEFLDGEACAEVAAITYAVQQCLKGYAAAMTTGPINKKKLIDRGFSFSGHTDFLGALCNAEPVMAFTGGSLKVVLVTTHIPLFKVPKAINAHNIRHTVHTAAHHLRQDLGIANPRFAVCGVNPHAGEEGVLGEEEKNIIHPCCAQLREDGFDVVGAVSAETAFLMARRNEVDMVVAMYHDQGLAPLKAVDFGRSVNWTLGLPIIRTSVDHGTADALVGQNKADHRSLLAAIELADRIASCRQSSQY